MKFSINTNALKESLGPERIVRLALELGLDGIEWGVLDGNDPGPEMAEMAARTADAGLEAVGWLLGGKPWEKKRLENYARLAASTGCRRLRLEHPWIAWDFHESLHQAQSFGEIFDRTAGCLPFLDQLAAGTGVRFVFETHAGGLLASTLAAAKLLGDYSPERFGVIYDPANTLLEGNLRPRSEVEVLGAHLAWVHAKNVAPRSNGDKDSGPARLASWTWQTVPPDRGALDWVEVFFALKNGGFEGFVSSEEYFSPGDPGELARGIAFLRKCEEIAPAAPEAPFTVFNRLQED